MTTDETNNQCHKQKLGQFYTTNHEYILQGMKIPDTIKNIIEPFTGNGDLISFIKKEEGCNNTKYSIEVLTKHMHYLNKKVVLCTQELTAYFCVRFILDMDIES